MSAKDLANYLEQRVAMLGLSKSEAARRADISRQTWYRLLSAEVSDTKLSTVVSLAEALETTPIHLLRLYFGEETADKTAYSLAVSANNHSRAQA